MMILLTVNVPVVWKFQYEDEPALQALGKDRSPDVDAKSHETPHRNIAR